MILERSNERPGSYPGVAKFGIALEWGSRGRWFESSHSDHVGASSISLAPTFFKRQSALMPLLLLSKSNPLRWASIWFLREDGIKSVMNSRTK